MRVHNFDIEKAKKLLQLNLEVRRNNPNIFLNRDIFSFEIQQAIEVYQIYVLRNTPENHKVSMFRLGDHDSNKFVVLDIVRMASASLDARLVLMDDQELINGEILIHDMTGFGFKHLLKCVANALVIKKYMKYSQEAAAVKLIQNHFINCSPVVPKLMNLIKPLLNEEVKESLKFHSNIDSLYEFIPRELLDINGSFDAIFEVWKDKFKTKR